MRLLFADRYAPIASEYGFVEADYERVASWFRDWDASLQQPRGVVVHSRRLSGSLETSLCALEPLTSVERRRFLFMRTESQWTAYFDNGWQGADAARLAYFAREMKCRAVRLVAVPDTMGPRATRSTKGRYGATIFELYGSEPTDFLNYVRTVAVVNDGGKWTFHQSGDALPFEDPGAYEARSIKDRFRLEHLARILKGMGIDAFNEPFFSQDAVLVERQGPAAPDMREYRLHEVRSTFGET